jgi:hypothetical protein
MKGVPRCGQLGEGEEGEEGGGESGRVCKKYTSTAAKSSFSLGKTDLRAVEKLI